MPKLSLAFLCLLAIVLICLSASPIRTNAQNQPKPLELSRPARASEFLPVVGQRAALFGQETGSLEGWVYPLKIFRDFHLNVLTEGRVLPAETLARTVTVRPECAVITYSGDTFSIRETLFVPVHEPGALMLFDVQTVQPLELEAGFERDFELEWPAAIGGTYINWDVDRRAFYFGEESKKYAAFLGSPTSTDASVEYFTNYSASRQSSFRLGVINKGRESRVIAFAASVQGAPDAEKTYKHLLADAAVLLIDSADFYRDYLNRTVSLDLPDAQLQQAYDWSRVSMIQGLVQNPSLGTGLVAGYRTSGDYERPGFAWFFGRDSLWTSFALNASGDFATTRTALDFLSKFQRNDGKIEHEIAQAAHLVDWFKGYPYAYASADATPLYIIAMNDYITGSGDVEFVQQKWESIWRAYQFLRSTYGSEGYPQNYGVGHGWIEGGPLLPVKAEAYQVGLGAQALHALANLARLTSKSELESGLEKDFATQRDSLNKMFWSPEKNAYAYAVDLQGKRIDITSVLTTVPMWFGLLEHDHAEATLNQLADDDHQADWGMRIISNRDPHYNPGGYHFGSVWPLFTGWASVGEYRYHRALPAFLNLRANALQVFDDSLGHVTEVLSGDYYQGLSTASPHQIWSAAMVVSPLLRGMMGLQSDAISHSLTFAPELPVDWRTVAVHNIHVGTVILDLTYERDLDGITLRVQRSGSGECNLTFSPALSLHAEVVSVDENGHHLQPKIEPNSEDQHVTITIPVKASTSLRVRTRKDFGIAFNPGLPPLGSDSQGLRIISTTWNSRHDALTIHLAGIAGSTYELPLWNGGEIASIRGAEIRNYDQSMAIRLAFPSGHSNTYVPALVQLQLRP